MPAREPVVGLEVHIQLHTQTKLFCSCPTRASEPNTATCEVCLGMPGSKPVINKKAIEFALRIAEALHCKVNKEFFFSRKTYFYPDMAKNFQITQYEIPLAEKGYIELSSGKKVRITRMHLEEDPAALLHGEGISKPNYSLVDYNRSGIPLAEIVTEPDMNSPEEAREFLNELCNLLNYLEVYEPGEDTLKADTNVSLKGSERVEVKNVSGRKAVEAAAAYEIKRQSLVLDKGEKVERETRAFDEGKQSTRSMRKKETEEDYGYIFEADLPTFEVTGEMLKAAKKAIPERPKERAKRFVEEYNLTPYDAKVLCSDLHLSNLFEQAANATTPKLAATFLTRELLAILNRDNLTVKESGIEKEKVIALLKLLADGNVTEKNAKMAMVKYVTEKQDPVEWIDKNGLTKDMGSDLICAAVEKVLNANPQGVKDLKKGEKKALNFLLGLIMRETKGKAEPREVQKIIEKRIK